jgi:hypothetical protein
MQWLNPLNLAFVAVVALVVVGPERLPGSLRTMGKYWAEFQRLRTSAESQVREVVGDLGIGDLGIPLSTNPSSLARNYLQGFNAKGTEAQTIPASATTSSGPSIAAVNNWQRTNAFGGQREMPQRRVWSAPGRLVPAAPELDPGFDDPICN